MHRSCPSVCPSVSLSVSLSVCRQNSLSLLVKVFFILYSTTVMVNKDEYIIQKKRFSQKLSNLELWSLLQVVHGFSNNPLLDP